MELSDQVKSELEEIFAEFKTYLDSIRPQLDAASAHFKHVNHEGKKIRVEVDDGAFLSILTSSVEVYPSSYIERGPDLPGEGEVWGRLFGTVTEDDAAITYAVTGASVMQNYEYRTNGSCCPSMHHDNKVTSITEAIPGLICLGSFHSHPYIYSDFTTEYCSHWSETDYKSTLATAKNYAVPPLELIFALSHLNSAKIRQPKYMSSYLVNYCRNFKFVLRAFVLNVLNDTLDDVDTLRCNLAGKIVNRSPRK